MRLSLLILTLLIYHHSFAQKDELLKSEWFGDFAEYWKFDTIKKTALLLSDSSEFNYKISVKESNSRILFRNYPFNSNPFKNRDHQFSYEYSIIGDTLFLDDYPYRLYRNNTKPTYDFDSIDVYLPEWQAYLRVYPNKSFLLSFPSKANSKYLGFYFGNMDSLEWETFTSKITETLLQIRHKDWENNSKNCADCYFPDLLKIYTQDGRKYWEFFKPEIEKKLNEYYSKEIINLTFSTSFANGKIDTIPRQFFEYYNHKCKTSFKEYFIGIISKKMYSNSSSQYYYHFISGNDTLIMHSKLDLPQSTKIGVFTTHLISDNFMNLVEISNPNTKTYEIKKYIIINKTTPFFKPCNFPPSQYSSLNWRYKKRELKKLLKTDEAQFLLKKPK